MAPARIPGFCTLCRSRCGTLNTVDGDRLVRVEPDPGHPTGRAICSKGRAAPEIAHGSHRLRTPLRRTRPKGDPNPGWVPVGWDEAMGDIAARLAAQKAAEGAESVAFAVTSPSGTPISDAIDWIERFVRLFGSPNTAYSTEICNWHKDHAHAFTYGAGIGTPEYANADLILLWGHNPSAVWLAQADAIALGLRRGARLAVVDPRRTPYAGQADHWLRVRPGTDAALALGLIREMLATGAYDAEFVRRWTNAPFLVRADDGRLLRLDGAFAVFDEATGCLVPASAAIHPALHGVFDADGIACRTALDALAAACEPFDAARVETITTVPESAVRNAAAAIGAARSVAYYCWTGVGQHADATQTDRAIAILTALTGTYDVPGGNREYTRQPTNKVNGFDLLAPAQKAKALGLDQRPLGPPSQGWITAADLYRAVLEERPYAVRALVSFGANLVVSHADPVRAKAALAALDFHVHCDLFETPTGRFADYLLPVCSPWEREGLRVGFEIDAAAEELVQLRPRMVPPLGQSRSDMEIVFDLAERLGLSAEFFDGDIEAGWDHMLAPLGLTVAELRRNPAGIRRSLAQAPRRYAGRDRAFATETGRIELYSERLLRHGSPPLPTYAPPPEAPSDDFPFSLTTANSGHYCHSQQRGIASLRRRAPEPSALLPPAAAAAAGVSDGDWVRLRTRAGSARFRARIAPDLHHAVIVADYGWWQACPDLALPGYDVASPEGSNYNALVPAEHSDPVSGSVPMRSLSCAVEREDVPYWAGWRELRVTAIAREAQDVVSVTLESTDGLPLPDYLPGQHLPLKLEPAGGPALERHYSLSGASTVPDRVSYRVTVKRLPGGLGSEHMVQSLRQSDTVRARRPGGRFAIPLRADFPVVMLAAGIGITPFMAVLETLAGASQAERMQAPRVVLHYGNRDGASHAFRARLAELQVLLPTLDVVDHYSRPGLTDVQGRDFDRTGRIRATDVAADLIEARARFYLCGPPGMLAELAQGLATLGIPPFEIFQEAFVAVAVSSVQLAGPGRVEFRRSEKTVPWRPENGTVLDLAEASGLALPSGCRVGTCESCAVPVISGAFHYTTKVDHDEAGTCLTCRAVPDGELVLDA